jgi:transposase InsO family protein
VVTFESSGGQCSRSSTRGWGFSGAYAAHRAKAFVAEVMPYSTAHGAPKGPTPSEWFGYSCIADQDDDRHGTAVSAQRIFTIPRSITCSMSPSGNVWDNSAMECFFSTLKVERVHRQVYGPPHLNAPQPFTDQSAASESRQQALPLTQPVACVRESA